MDDYDPADYDPGDYSTDGDGTSHRRVDDRETNAVREDEPLVKMGYEGNASAALASTGDDLWEMHAAGTKIVEFTAGRTLAEFEQHEALRAAIRSMLSLMAGALARLLRTAPEIAGRVDGPDLLELSPRLGAAVDSEIWDFVQLALPELLARTQTELSAWHEA